MLRGRGVGGAVLALEMKEREGMQLAAGLRKRQGNAISPKAARRKAALQTLLSLGQ